MAVYTNWDSLPASGEVIRSSDLDVTTGQGISQLFAAGMDQNPVAQAVHLMKQRELSGADLSPEERATRGGDATFGKHMTADEANAFAKSHNVSVPVPREGINSKALAWRVARNIEAQRREILIREAELGGVTSFVTSLTAAMVDPVNLVLGGAAAKLLPAAKTTQALARTRHGAASGFVGGVPTELATFALSDASGGDYSAYEAFLGITAGTVFGAGLGGVGDALSGVKSMKRAVTQSVADQSSAKLAIWQAMTGRDIDVKPGIADAQKAMYPRILDAAEDGNPKQLTELLLRQRQLDPDLPPHTKKTLRKAVEDVMESVTKWGADRTRMQRDLETKFGHARDQEAVARMAREEPGKSKNDKEISRRMQEQAARSAEKVKEVKTTVAEDGTVIGPQEAQQRQFTDRVEQEVDLAMAELEEAVPEAFNSLEADRGKIDDVVKTISELVDGFRSAIRCSVNGGR